MTHTGYRVSQFVQALLAQPAAADVRLATDHLPPSLQTLYNGMSRAERSHSLAVLRALLRQGQTDPDLLAAALLHDVGKTRAPLRMFDRVLVVLTQRVAPAAARDWSTGAARGWRRPFVVAARHPDWGGEFLEQAGASPRLVDMVRRHHAVLPPLVTEVDRLLAALQAADGSH
jgi:putative nucleotidyltransferase with HDIG domain